MSWKCVLYYNILRKFLVTKDIYIFLVSFHFIYFLINHRFCTPSLPPLYFILNWIQWFLRKVKEGQFLQVLKVINKYPLRLSLSLEYHLTIRKILAPGTMWLCFEPNQEEQLSSFLQSKCLALHLQQAAKRTPDVVKGSFFLTFGMVVYQRWSQRNSVACKLWTTLFTFVQGP